jgi:hypothetical protein
VNRVKKASRRYEKAKPDIDRERATYRSIREARKARYRRR